MKSQVSNLIELGVQLEELATGLQESLRAKQQDLSETIGRLRTAQVLVGLLQDEVDSQFSRVRTTGIVDIRIATYLHQTALSNLRALQQMIDEVDREALEVTGDLVEDLPTSEPIETQLRATTLEEIAPSSSIPSVAVDTPSVTSEPLPREPQELHPDLGADSDQNEAEALAPAPSVAGNTRPVRGIGNLVAIPVLRRGFHHPDAIHSLEELFDVGTAGTAWRTHLMSRAVLGGTRQDRRKITAVEDLAGTTSALRTGLVRTITQVHKIWSGELARDEVHPQLAALADEFQARWPEIEPALQRLGLLS